MSKKKNLLLLFALPILGVLLGIGILVLLNRAAKPEHYVDLEPQRPEVLDSANGFYPLAKALDSLALSENEAAKVNELLSTNAWDGSTSQRFLAENEAALSLVDEALQGAIIIPERYLSDSIANPPRWRDLARLVMLRARQHHESGNSSEAFKDFTKSLELGHAIEGAGGAIIHYLIGSGIKTATLLTASQFIAADCDKLRSLLSQLEHFRQNTSGVSNVLKVEMQETFRNLELSFTNSNPAADPFFQIGKPVFYNSKQTKSFLADVTRSSLESVSKVYNEMPVHAALQVQQKEIDRGVFRLMVSGNAIGRMLGTISIAGYTNFFSRLCSEDFHVSAFQTALALQCYRRDNGKLPESLEALVPEYLPSIPLDRFDGKPIRYSAEKKIIYSVGADLIDSEGVRKNEEGKTLDIVFPLHF